MAHEIVNGSKVPVAPIEWRIGSELDTGAESLDFGPHRPVLGRDDSRAGRLNPGQHIEQGELRATAPEVVREDEKMRLFQPGQARHALAKQPQAARPKVSWCDRNLASAE